MQMTSTCLPDMPYLLAPQRSLPDPPLPMTATPHGLAEPTRAVSTVVTVCTMTYAPAAMDWVED